MSDIVSVCTVNLASNYDLWIGSFIPWSHFHTILLKCPWYINPSSCLKLIRPSSLNPVTSRYLPSASLHISSRVTSVDTPCELRIVTVFASLLNVKVLSVWSAVLFKVVALSPSFFGSLLVVRGGGVAGRILSRFHHSLIALWYPPLLHMWHIFAVWDLPVWLVLPRYCLGGL